MGGILLPDGTRIEDQALQPPSPDAQFLARGLQAIINTLSGIQVQLDLLIRMESQETSRSEIKSRIRRSDEAAQEALLKQQAEEQEKVAEAQRIIAARADEVAAQIGCASPPGGSPRHRRRPTARRPGRPACGPAR